VSVDSAMGSGYDGNINTVTSPQPPIMKPIPKNQPAVPVSTFSPLRAVAHFTSAFTASSAVIVGAAVAFADFDAARQLVEVTDVLSS